MNNPLLHVTTEITHNHNAEQQKQAQNYSYSIYMKFKTDKTSQEERKVMVGGWCWRGNLKKGTQNILDLGLVT